MNLHEEIKKRNDGNPYSAIKSAPDNSISIPNRSSNVEIELLRRELMQKLHALENPTEDETDMLFTLMFDEKFRKVFLAGKINHTP